MGHTGITWRGGVIHHRGRAGLGGGERDSREGTSCTKADAAATGGITKTLARGWGAAHG